MWKFTNKSGECGLSSSSSSNFSSSITRQMFTKHAISVAVLSKIDYILLNPCTHL